MTTPMEPGQPDPNVEPNADPNVDPNADPEEGEKYDGGDIPQAEPGTESDENQSTE
jgi:hypothetical protein